MQPWYGSGILGSFYRLLRKSHLPRNYCPCRRNIQLTGFAYGARLNARTLAWGFQGSLTLRVGTVFARLGESGYLVASEQRGVSPSRDRGREAERNGHAGS